MKQTLSAILIGLLACGSAFGLATQKTNTVNLVLANVCDGSFNDFKFQVSGYDDQVFKFNYDVDLTGVSCTFRVTKPMDGTVYLDVPVADITVSGTNVTFSIARTNIPPPGSYYGELLSYQTGTTNVYRSLAQGKIPITWSLYLNDDNYFERYTTNAVVGFVYIHPTWVNPALYWSGTGTVNALSNYVVYVDGVLQTNINTLSNHVVNTYAKQSDYQATSNALDTHIGEDSVTTNSGNWAGTWQGLGTNAFAPAGAATGTPVYVESDPVHANWIATDPAYLAALTNGTITESTSNAFWTDGRMIGLSVRTNYPSTGDMAQAQADIGNLQLSTGSLNIAVGSLNAATGSLDAAVGDLQASTGALNTAVGALNLSTNNLAGRVYTVETGKVDRVGDTNQIDFTSADVRIADSTISNNPITRSELDTLKNSLTVKDFYYTTNVHAVIAGAGTLPTENPGDCIFNTGALAAGTNILYTFWQTNTTTRIRDGIYESICHAQRQSGNSTAYMRFELLVTDDDGVTTNILAAGQALENISGLVKPYSTFLGLLDDTTNSTLRLGVRLSVVRLAAGTGATLQFYGGITYPSHLATPGIGDVSGYVTLESDPVFTASVAHGIVAGDTNKWNTASTDASSATGDVAAIEAWPTNDWATSGATNAEAGSAWAWDPVARKITINTNDFGGGGGVGTITNMLGSDGSIVWTDSGGPQPDGSVTAHVAGVVAGYVPTNDSAYLAIETNLLAFQDGSNISWRVDGTNVYPDLNPAVVVTSEVAALQGATGALNTAVGALILSTQAINIVANAALPKSATNNMSVTALQVTGGNPTNGAVMMATNSTGQGAWTRKLTKSYTINTRTTNATPITVSGIGFKPSGAIVTCAGDTVYGNSQGQIDGTGVQYCRMQYTSTQVSYSGSKCAIIYIDTSHAWGLTWTAWTDDGATFTQSTTAGISDVGILVYILFFP